MSLPEDWVPPVAEVPADHWSKSPEWLAHKAKQAEIEARLNVEKKNTLPAHMQVGTITPATRVRSTHDIQMDACKVEWVPTTDEDFDSIGVPLEEYAHKNEEALEEIAKTIVERISKVTDAPSG